MCPTWLVGTCDEFGIALVCMGDWLSDVSLLGLCLVFLTGRSLPSSGTVQSCHHYRNHQFHQFSDALWLSISSTVIWYADFFCFEKYRLVKCPYFLHALYRFLGGLSLHLNHLYSIAHDNLRLAIWDTSFWTFLVKFGHKRTLRCILGPILVIFEICQFLTIPGPFEYFSENG